jgi:predicted dinucleotide-binding enzyme
MGPASLPSAYQELIGTTDLIQNARSGLDDRPLHRPEEHSEEREATGRVLRHQPHRVRRLPRRHRRIHLRTNVEDLASDADIVVIAVPPRRFTDLPLSPLADRIVIDVMNYWPRSMVCCPRSSTLATAVQRPRP